METLAVFMTLVEKGELNKVDMELLEKIGQERFVRVTKTIYQLEISLKQILLSEHGNKEAEDLLRKVSNNVAGHAGAENGKPKRVIEAFKTFIEKTGFA